jgi:CMP-N-acetylneuraminic acid synthetase
LVFLQCTSPLTLPEDINGTIKALVNEGADSALSVSPFHYFLWKKNPDGSAIGINHDKSQRLLRQEQDLQCIETGAVYAMKANGFKEAKHRFFGKTAFYIMPKERCLEIDDPVDFELAEFFLKKREEKKEYL